MFSIDWITVYQGITHCIRTHLHTLRHTNKNKNTRLGNNSSLTRHLEFRGKYHCEVRNSILDLIYVEMGNGRWRL